MSRYDILRNREIKNFTASTEVSDLFTGKAIVLESVKNDALFDGIMLDSSSEMRSLIGSEIIVERTKLEDWFFQETERGHGRDSDLLGIHGRRGWIYNKSWLKFIKN